MVRLDARLDPRHRAERAAPDADVAVAPEQRYDAHFRFGGKVVGRGPDFAGARIDMAGEDDPTCGDRG